MTLGQGQWPRVTGRTGQNQCALLLEKSVERLPSKGYSIWDPQSGGRTGGQKWKCGGGCCLCCQEAWLEITQNVNTKRQKTITKINLIDILNYTSCLPTNECTSYIECQTPDHTIVPIFLFHRSKLEFTSTIWTYILKCHQCNIILILRLGHRNEEKNRHVWLDHFQIL